MSVSPDIFLIIAGMGLVTFALRFLPLVFLSGRSLNPLIERWLSLVPPAVMAALLAPELLIDKATHNLNLNLDNVLLLAALPAGLVAWFTRSFFATIVTGLASLALIRYFMG